MPFAAASVRPIAFVRCGSLGVTDRYLTRTTPSLPREAPGREGASDCALHVWKPIIRVAITSLAGLSSRKFKTLQTTSSASGMSLMSWGSAAPALPGHASITNTVRYTAMSAEPFKDIGR